MQNCGEHNRGCVRDTVVCTQPWFHSFLFAAGKYHESNLDDMIATPCRIDVFAFAGILGGRRLPVVLCGEDPE